MVAHEQPRRPASRIPRSHITRTPRTNTCAAGSSRGGHPVRSRKDSKIRRERQPLRVECANAFMWTASVDRFPKARLATMQRCDGEEHALADWTWSMRRIRSWGRHYIRRGVWVTNALACTDARTCGLAAEVYWARNVTRPVWERAAGAPSSPTSGKGGSGAAVQRLSAHWRSPAPPADPSQERMRAKMVGLFSLDVLPPLLPAGV